MLLEHPVQQTLRKVGHVCLQPRQTITPRPLPQKIQIPESKSWNFQPWLVGSHWQQVGGLRCAPSIEDSFYPSDAPRWIFFVNRQDHSNLYEFVHISLTWNVKLLWILQKLPGIGSRWLPYIIGHVNGHMGCHIWCHITCHLHSYGYMGDCFTIHSGTRDMPTR